MARFILAVYGKRQKESDRLKEEPLNMKELRFADVGTSQPIQTAKDTIKSFTVRKACFSVKKKKKKEGMAGASFFSTSERSKGQSIQSHKRLFEKIKCVTHRSPQYLSRSQKREEIISHPENAIPVEMLLVCTERGREETKMKESWTTFKTLLARSRSIGALHSKLYSLNEKGKVTQRVEP